MFTAARRGHASIAKYLRLPSTSSTSCNLALSWKTTYFVARLAAAPASRAFNTASQWRQEATSQAQQYQRNGDDADRESTRNSPRPQAQYGPVTKFAELGERKLVCQSIVDRITDDMKLETMTHVQSLTINETLKGIDVLAQARTGTGKTLAFVIPVLQNIINVDPTLEFPPSFGRQAEQARQQYRNRGNSRGPLPLLDIRAIIISPTRELAEQIAVEARKVTRGTGVIVQTAVGGTRKREGLRTIQHEGCHVLVGTPGRLYDILSDPYSGVKAPNLSALVLDEADRLLDQGFSQEIEDIQKQLPSRSERDRQTLLFSATIPKEVMHMVRRTMKPDFEFVRTVKEGEQETHMKVPQKIAFVRGFDNVMPALVELCKREQQKSEDKTFKAIVYFGATSEVALAATTFANLNRSGETSSRKNVFYPASIIEMHGKLSQQERTRAADAFRRSKSGILLSSDVTARGMDFPNVTHVIQVGIPQTREAYVHRIGRTARADKGGEGWLLLTDLEKQEARGRLRDLPLVLDNSLETARIDMSQDAQLSASAAETLTQTINASKTLPSSVKNGAYLSTLGIYTWVPYKSRLIESMNARARYCWGMETPPSISPGLAGRLGLMGVPGVVIGYSDENGRDRGDFRSSSRTSSFGYSRGGSFGGGSFGGRDGEFSSRQRESSGGYQRSPWEGRGRTGAGYGRDRNFGGRDRDQGSFRDRGSFRERGSFRDRGGDRSSRGYSSEMDESTEW